MESGDETELTYFQCLNEYLDSSLIQIEILRHKKRDGYSDPTCVIEVLQEYLAIMIPLDCKKTSSLVFSWRALTLSERKRALFLLTLV